MNDYSRKKTHFAGYLAKYMYLKVCRQQSFDPTEHFFELAARVYNPLATKQDSEENSDNDDNSAEDVDNVDFSAVFQ